MEPVYLGRCSDGVTGWTVRGLNPGKVRDFYLPQNVQTGSEIHPDSCSTDTDWV